MPPVLRREQPPKAWPKSTGTLESRPFCLVRAATIPGFKNLGAKKFSRNVNWVDGESRAISKKLQATKRLGVVYATREGEYTASLVERVPHRDETSALLPCLNNQDRVGEPAQNSVA